MHNLLNLESPPSFVRDVLVPTLKSFAAGAILMFGLGAVLQGCAGQIAQQIQPVIQQGADALIKDLAALNNTAGPDLAIADAEAKAIVPSTGKSFDQPLGQCLDAAIVVKGDLAALIAASNQTGAGVITVAATAEIVQINGPFYTQEQALLQGGCASVALETMKAQGIAGGIAMAGAFAVQNLPAIITSLGPAAAAL